MSTQDNTPAYEFKADWYDARAKNWRWKQAKTGNWMLEVWFEMSDEGGSLGELPGWLVFTEKTVDKKVEQLIAMGYQPVSGDLGVEIMERPDGTCVGNLDANTVRAIVEFGDDGRAKVGMVVAQKPREAKPVDQAALRGFGAQMRQAVLGAAQRAKATGTAPVARPTNGAPQPRPQSNARPAPVASRGPGAPRNAQPEAYDPTGGDEDSVPF